MFYGIRGHAGSVAPYSKGVITVPVRAGGRVLVAVVAVVGGAVGVRRPTRVLVKVLAFNA